MGVLIDATDPWFEELSQWGKGVVVVVANKLATSTGTYLAYLVSLCLPCNPDGRIEGRIQIHQIDN